MKQAISFVLCVAAGIGYLAVRSYTTGRQIDTSGMELVYSQDFESGRSGLKTNDPECFSTSSEVASSGRRSLLCKPSKVKWNFCALKRKLDWRDSWIFEFDLYIHEDEPGGKKTDDGGRNRLPGRFSTSVYGVFHTSENYLLAFKKGGYVTCCGSKAGIDWSPGEWHHVQIRLDPDREDKSFSAWAAVDGSAVYRWGLPLPDKGRSLGKLARSPELWLSFSKFKCSIDNLEVWASES